LPIPFGCRRIDMRAFLLVLIATPLLAQSQPQTEKQRKLQEIDDRLSVLQREIDGLKALRENIDSGRIPESSLAFIDPASIQTRPEARAVSAPPSTAPSAVPSSAASKAQTDKHAAAASSPQSPVPSKASADKPSGATTPTGAPIYVGPRGGQYHYSASGKKVYERRKK
jgi:hypothetical protein